MSDNIVSGVTEMASIPAMMFLFENDSIEVRYSDGSRLELSACGSTMVHHNGPMAGSARFTSKGNLALA